MALATPITDITHVIQLAVAPVFLLTAVGTIITALTNRLGRAIDRRRVVVRLRQRGGDPHRDGVVVEPLLQQLAPAYVDAGKVQVTFHNFAFLGAESEWAAQAAK